MIFAQFFETKLNGKLDHALGDRSVIIIDARLKSETIGQIAAMECKKRGYEAWQIFRGDSFTRSRPVSQVRYVHKDEPVRDPVWLRAHD